MKKLGALLLSLTLVLALFPMTAGAASANAPVYLIKTDGTVVNITDGPSGGYTSDAALEYILNYVATTPASASALGVTEGVIVLDGGAYTITGNTLLTPGVDTSGITLVLNGATVTATGSAGNLDLALAGLATTGSGKFVSTASSGSLYVNLIVDGTKILHPDTITLGASGSATYTSLGTSVSKATISASSISADTTALYNAVKSATTYKLTLTAGAAVTVAATKTYTLPAGCELVTGAIPVAVAGTLNVNGSMTTSASGVITGAGTVNVGTTGTLVAGAAVTTDVLNVAGSMTITGAKLSLADDSTISGTLTVKGASGVVDIAAGKILTIANRGLLKFADDVTAANALAGGSTNSVLYVASGGTLDLGSTHLAALAILDGFADAGNDNGIFWLGTEGIVKPTTIDNSILTEIFGNLLVSVDDGGTPSDPSDPTSTVTGPKGSNLSTPLNKGGKYAITNVVRDGNGNLVVTVIGAANMVNGISINGVSLTRDYDFVVGASGILSTITVNSASIPTSGTLNINVKFVNDGSASASAVR